MESNHDDLEASLSTVSTKTSKECYEEERELKPNTRDQGLAQPQPQTLTLIVFFNIRIDRAPLKGCGGSVRRNFRESLRKNGGIVSPPS